jgi:predicted small secreted protein
MKSLLLICFLLSGCATQSDIQFDIVDHEAAVKNQYNEMLDKNGTRYE